MRSEIVLLLLCGLTLMSGGCDRRSATGGQGGDTATTPAANAAAAPTSGEVAPVTGAAPKTDAFDPHVDVSHKGDEAPDMVFSDPAGKDVTLANFRGKAILVNLWATWCGPCVAEMPMLDGIARDYGGKGLVVLTVSQDTGDAAQVAAFFERQRLPHLAAWRDPENQLGFHFATGLLPTSVLYDREGHEVARVAGAMDWSGAQGRTLIEDLVGG